MSFLPINEENQTAPQGQTTNNPQGQPPPQMGGSAGAGTAGGGAKGSATGTPTQFGSSASKLGDYLSANAPQIGAQADKVAGTLNTQYGNLNQGITNAANQFQQQVQGGYAAPNQDVVNQAKQNPTNFVSNPNNIKAFQAQYNDQYTGPQNFESFQPYSQIQGDVQNAVKQGNLLGTQPGLQSYLQGQQKNPTTASSTLNSLLLSGNPEANQKVQNAANQFNTLTGQLETAKTGANQSVQDAQKAAQDAATYAKGQFDPYAQNFNTDIQNNASQAEAQRQAYNQSLAANQSAANTGRQNLLNTKQTALAPVEAFWAKQGQWAPQSKDALTTIRQLFNPNTSQYDQILGGKMNNTLATTANTATTPQYAQANALSQLLGTNYTSPLDQTLASQAGTWQTPGTLPSNDAANTNAVNQGNYIKDLSSLYSSPSGVTFMNANPQAEASQLANMYQTDPNMANYPGSTPELMAALQRLSANNYGI